MDESTFICFSFYEGSARFLVTIDHAGSRLACAGSDVATPIRPITERRWLSPAFRYPSSRQPTLRSAFLRRGEMLGLPCFAQAAMDGLAPAYYTGSHLIRVPAC